MRTALLKGIGYGLALLLACNLLTVFRLLFGGLLTAGKWIERNPVDFTVWALLVLSAGFVVTVNRYNAPQRTYHAKSDKK